MATGAWEPRDDGTERLSLGSIEARVWLSGNAPRDTRWRYMVMVEDAGRWTVASEGVDRDTDKVKARAGAIARAMAVDALRRANRERREEPRDSEPPLHDWYRARWLYGLNSLGNFPCHMEYTPPPNPDAVAWADILAQLDTDATND